MAINYKIPPQARFLPTSTIFSATFNAITPGRYDFSNDPTNTDRFVMEFQPSTVYLIERMSVGGNVSEADFLSSIADIATFGYPRITFRRSAGRESMYQSPIAIANFFDGLESGIFVHSDRRGEMLNMSFQGSFTQTPAMVGLLDLRLQISLNIYAIDSAYYNAAYRDGLPVDTGRSLRR